MPKRLVTFFIIGFLIFLFVFLLYPPLQKKSEPVQIKFNDFISAVREKKVESVIVKNSLEVLGRFQDGRLFVTVKESGYSLTPLLSEYNIKFEFVYEEDKSSSKFWWYMLINGLLGVGFVILIVIVFRKIFSSTQNGLNRFNFHKGQVEIYDSKDTTRKKTFADVAGIDEIQEEVKEIVDFLKTPKDYNFLGARIPRGVLLIGPSGVGKTLLARAVAGEAEVPFLTISGSGFVELFVGVGAGRVRHLFEEAKKRAPCIVFIDEIDAVGRQRGAGLGGGHDEREQTLNQLLIEMDGFRPNSGVVVIAATNRPDILDQALLRAGRFDRKLYVNPPDLAGREKILEVHSRDKKLDESVDLKVIARKTPGLTGADLETIVNEAALLAGRLKESAIKIEHLERAREKLLMGPERKLYIGLEEKKIVAVHEAGHALLALVLPCADPLCKVSIIPRGPALGITFSSPKEDKHLISREALIDKVKVILGGRASEEVLLESITSGAQNDLEQATKLLCQMVGRFGMDEEFGLLSLGEESLDPFLGRKMAMEGGASDKTKHQLEQRVRHLAAKYYEEVKILIGRNKEAVLLLTDELLKKESLDSEEVKQLLDGKLSS